MALLLMIGPAVSKLAYTYPDLIIPSFGMHPWQFTKDSNRWNSGSWFVELREYLERHSNAAIGECGIDRWMENPDITAQEEAFLMQLELAAALNLAISIHVLKAWGLFTEMMRSSALPARGFLLHGYSGSYETAQQLMAYGAHFSFSGYFLYTRKKTGA